MNNYRKQTAVYTSTANEEAKTYTINRTLNGVVDSEYLTYEMSEEEFESNRYNTSNDWRQFLTTDEYTIIF